MDSLKEKFLKFKNKLLNNNKTIYFLMVSFSLVIIVSSLGVGLSSVKEETEVGVPGKSSFSLAIASPRNGNFLKFLGSQQIASTYTTGVFVPPPPDVLYEKLQLPKVKMDGIENVTDITQPGSVVDIFSQEEQKGFQKTNTSFTGFWRFAFPGMIDVLRPYGTSGSSIASTLYLEDYSGMVFMLKKDNKWWDWERTENGKTEIVSDYVVASDFVQTWKYILDLTTGSELLKPTLDVGVKNTESCNVQQEEYIKQSENGTPIDNPFGYSWSEQKQMLEEARRISPEEVTRVQAEIDKVNTRAKEKTPACFNLFLELPKERIDEYDLTNDEDVSELQKLVDDAGIIFDNKNNYLYFKYEVRKDGLNGLLSSNYFPDGAHFLPSNKKFIDYVGGIDKYGLDKSTIIGNGSHKIKDVVFGNLGYALLTPNKDFWAYDTMLTGNIKLIFNQEPYAVNALFRDNKIAKTRLTKQNLEYFYNTKEYRQYLKKQTGFGTFSLALNIPLNKDTVLKDPDLRRALYYIMNREQALKIANWDSTFPVTTFSAFKQSSALTSYRSAVEIYQDNDVVNTEAPSEDGGKNIPLRTVKYLYQMSKSNEIESIVKKDHSFLPKVANFYLNRFKKNHPDLGSVTLEFLYDTSSNESKRMYILLDSLTRKYFGDYLRIEGKGVPSNFFESLRTTGKFDITTRVVEPSGSGHLNYFKYFFWTDGLSNEVGNLKRSGYRSNISGGFTFEKWFNSIASNEESVRQRLGIRKDIWDYIKFMTRPLTSSNPDYDEGYLGQGLVNWKKRISKIEVVELSTDDLNQYQDLSDTIKDFVINYNTIKVELTAAFEKLLRESVPVIPVMEVDTYWTATKLYGDQSYNKALVFMFPYLCNTKPLAILPGCEAISGI